MNHSSKAKSPYLLQIIYKWNRRTFSFQKNYKWSKYTTHGQNQSDLPSPRVPRRRSCLKQGQNRCRYLEFSWISCVMHTNHLTCFLFWFSLRWLIKQADSFLVEVGLSFLEEDRGVSMRKVEKRGCMLNGTERVCSLTRFLLELWGLEFELGVSSLWIHELIYQKQNLGLSCCLRFFSGRQSFYEIMPRI